MNVRIGNTSRQRGHTAQQIDAGDRPATNRAGRISTDEGGLYCVVEEAETTGVRHFHGGWKQAGIFSAPTTFEFRVDTCLFD